MACAILLENGDDLLLEDNFFLQRESIGGYLVLETGDKLLQEDGFYIWLEDIPCGAGGSTTTTVVVILRSYSLGNRRFNSQHSRGIRPLVNH